MSETILDKIFAAKRVRVESAIATTTLNSLKESAFSVRLNAQPHRFRDALADRSRINIIAEFKKASPSKGVINGDADPAAIAFQYEAGGAAAISVLTEEDFFKGSLDDLQAIREAVSLPVLRKDFIFDECQIYEAVAAGADAILLIAAMVGDEELQSLLSVAENLGMDALVEVHTLEELERVNEIGSTLIGVNNRNLKTFEVSLDVAREMIKSAPPNAIMVAESGLKTRQDIEELHGIGYSGFLIGETLISSGDPTAELRKLND